MYIPYTDQIYGAACARIRFNYRAESTMHPGELNSYMSSTAWLAALFSSNLRFTFAILHSSH